MGVRNCGPPPVGVDFVQVAHAPLFRHLEPTIWERQADRAIVYTTWEASRLPVSWVEAINEFDACFTTSEWSKQNFIDDGVTVPIFVVHHGVDPGAFPPIWRPHRDTFTFLWQGMSPGPIYPMTLDEPVVPPAVEVPVGTNVPPWFMDVGKDPYSEAAIAARSVRSSEGDRKQALLVREAFLRLRESGEIKDDARLILKWTTVFNKRWEISNYPLDGTLIDTYGAKFSPDDMRAILLNSDVSVNPYRAEGFGMIPLEHMATGLPTIQTEYSGPMDYLETMDGNYLGLTPVMGPSFFDQQARRAPVCGRGADPVDAEFGEYLTTQSDLGEDAQVDIGELMERMLFAYKHREAVKDMGLRASALVHKQWSWERAFQQVVDALRELGWLDDLMWSHRGYEERKTSIINPSRHRVEAR
jgi:glycosyltransferase involved in cell wall biosynthesis